MESERQTQWDDTASYSFELIHSGRERPWFVRAARRIRTPFRDVSDQRRWFFGPTALDRARAWGEEIFE